MDVVALAKAGYSVKDVKELIALSKEEPKDEVKEESKDMPKDEVKKEPKEEPKDEVKEEPKDDKPDYEKLYKDLIKSNTNKDNSGNEKSDDELLADLVRDFM